MDIQIINRAGDDNGYHYAERYLDTLMGQDTREFRVDTTTSDVGFVLRIAMLDLIIKTEAKRCAEYYEDGEASVSEIYMETGRLSTMLENGTGLHIEPDSFSIYLPVHDGFEDKETHWVAAVPVMRKLLVH